ncbi:MAG: 23S rRNA (uracil(1939)-C(5))-methyltransferase RlmD [Chlamydiota bacterium]
MLNQAELSITEISQKGDGVAHLNNLCIEIPHTLPGDVIKAHWGRKRKGFAKGRLEEILTLSPLRGEPKCPHSRICGGCHFHEMLYTHQLRHKEKILQELFQKLPLDILPIVPADPYWQYRNKMEFTFSQNRANTQFLGLMIARAQNYVFNLEHCHLAAPWFSKVLLAVKEFWGKSGLSAFDPPRNSGTFRTLTLREGKRTDEKMVILTVAEEIISSHAEAFVQAVLSVENVTSIIIRWQKTEKGVPTQFIDTLLYGRPYIQEKLLVQDKEFVFRISSSSFFQPNTFQAEKLYTLALALAKPTKDMIVYDLYCGTGTIGMFFSPFVKKVYGIESNEEAVANGKENLQENRISNVVLYSGMVEKLVETLPEKPDLVIVDPPRCGLDAQTISYLMKLAPKKILYISCNPKTQVRDIELFSSYRPIHMQPVDQFPHTVHIENIVLLDLIF